MNVPGSSSPPRMSVAGIPGQRSAHCPVPTLRRFITYGTCGEDEKKHLCAIIPSRSAE
jgi:hypothetical protein